MHRYLLHPLHSNTEDETMLVSPGVPVTAVLSIHITPHLSSVFPLSYTPFKLTIPCSFGVIFFALQTEKPDILVRLCISLEIN